MINRREIEKIAYELYLGDGCIPGREFDHWIEAERIFHSRQAAFAEIKPSFSKKAAPEKTGKKKVAAMGSKTSSKPNRPGRVRPK